MTHFVSTVVAAALALFANAHALHRTPEVYIALERVLIDEQPATGITVRLKAEDALVLVGEHLGSGDASSLQSAEVKNALLEAIEIALDTEPTSTLERLGVEVDGDLAFGYFSGVEDVVIKDAHVLSSVYRAWTNYVRDERAGGRELLFTQQGPMMHHPQHRHGRR